MSLLPPDYQDLTFSGIFGSLARLVIRPEESWQAWVTQVFVGVVCAVFIGGLAAHYLNAGRHGVLACGFVFGSLGEHGLKMLQKRVMNQGEEKEKEK